MRLRLNEREPTMHTPRSSLRRDVFRCLAAGAALTLVAAAPVAAQDTEEFTGTFGQLNDSGLSGEISVSLTGTSAEVSLNVAGVVDLVHAQHFHGEYGADNVCPTIDLDVDGDGLISTVEGVPSYGAVKASLVTEGPTDESYALAVEAFPVASGGVYEYSRTIEVPQELADNMESMIVVVHGIDLDGSGEYDGEALSSLSADLPLEATIPAGCATLVAAGMTPVGSVAAGAGGTTPGEPSGATSSGLVLIAAGAGVVALAAGVRRRLA